MFMSVKHGLRTYEIFLPAAAAVRLQMLKDTVAAKPEAELTKQVEAEFADLASAVEIISAIPWERLSEATRLIRWQEEPFDHFNGAYSQPYATPAAAELPETAALSMPLNLMTSRMFQQGESMAAHMIGVESDPVSLLVLLIQGTPEQLEAHYATAKQLQEQMIKTPEGAVEPPRPAFPH